MVNTNINDGECSEVGIVEEFQHLVLDSLQHSSKAEPPNNRSAKHISFGILLLRHNQYLFFFFIFLMCGIQA